MHLILFCVLPYWHELDKYDYVQFLNYSIKEKMQQKIYNLIKIVTPNYMQFFWFWIYTIYCICILFISKHILECVPSICSAFQEIIWRRKSAVVTTVLCCGDLIILLAFYSPNCLPPNKSLKCFLFKILILIAHNLWENLSAMSPLRSGKFHHGKAAWWSEYRAQLLHVLLTWFSSPPQLLRAVCLSSHAAILCL